MSGKGGKRTTSWKKGQSGNPSGRPKLGSTWREIIDAVGEETWRAIDKKHAVGRAMFREAIKGNTSAAHWLAKYGGGVTELSELSDNQLRKLLALRFGIADDSDGAGADSE